MNPPNNSNLREALAALCHEQWSGWMKYLFTDCHGYSQWEDNKAACEREGAHIRPDQAIRWCRQIVTSYAELSEEEKESDRKEADKIIELLKKQGFVLLKECEPDDSDIEIPEHIF